MSPLEFVDYTCGHSTPVRGRGAVVNRPCPDCECRQCGARVERGPLGSLYNADGSFHEHDDANPNDIFRWYGGTRQRRTS